MIDLLNYNHTNIPYNLPVNILGNISLSDSLEYKNREILFIEDICKRVKKSKSVLYVLQNKNNTIGLIALSVTSIEEQPSLQIDYILVNKEYQGKKLEILDDCKPFRYLIKLALIIAEKTSREIGLGYIVLSPDNDNLQAKYSKVGFKQFSKDWMYLKI